MTENIVVLTTGGTIDKVYFDAQSDYEIGHSIVPSLLLKAGVSTSVEVISLMQKDSLDMTHSDRESIKEYIEELESGQIVITHGTDTMVETAKVLSTIKNKTIVLTGALAPARFFETDAVFNIGLAFGAVQSLPNGIYITMNGQVFDALHVQKNRAKGRFENVE